MRSSGFHSPQPQIMRQPHFAPVPPQPGFISGEGALGSPAPPLSRRSITNNSSLPPAINGSTSHSHSQPRIPQLNQLAQNTNHQPQQQVQMGSQQQQQLQQQQLQQPRLVSPTHFPFAQQQQIQQVNPSKQQQLTQQQFQQQQQLQQQQHSARLNSPAPRMGLTSNSTLSNSQILSSQNLSQQQQQQQQQLLPQQQQLKHQAQVQQQQLTTSIQQQMHSSANRGAVNNSVGLMTPTSPANSSSSQSVALQFQKAASAALNNLQLTPAKSAVSATSSTQQQQVQQLQAGQSNDLESQVKKLKAELATSRALCANTQKHNDQLIQKIKVLIKENEKIQAINPQTPNQNSVPAATTPSTAPFVVASPPTPTNSSKQLSEASANQGQAESVPDVVKFQAVTRDLESKIKLLILENERLVFMLKQAQIVQSSQQQQQQQQQQLQQQQQTDQSEGEKNKNSIIEESKKDTAAGIPNPDSDKLSEELKVMQSENASLLIKIKELNVENEKLREISTEAFTIPEQQVTQIEDKLAAILDENQRVTDLLTEKNAEAERLQARVSSLEQQQSVNPKQDGNDTAPTMNVTHPAVHAKVMQLCETNRTLYEKITSLNQQLLLLESKEESAKTINDLKQKCATLTEEIATFKNAGEQPSALHARFFEYERIMKQESEGLKRQRDERARELSETLIQLQTTSQRVLHLNQELNSKSNEINQLKAKVAAGMESIVNQKIQVDSLVEQLREKNVELLQKTTSIERLDDQVVQLAKEKVVLTNESSRLNVLLSQTIESNSSIVKDLAESRAELVDVFASQSKVILENQQLHAKIQAQNEEISNLKAESVLKSVTMNGNSVGTHSNIDLFKEQREVLDKLLSFERELMVKSAINFQVGGRQNQ